MPQLNISLPLGFTASGINCGIKRYHHDLGLIYSDRKCVSQGMFTKNRVKGAHVIFDRALLPASSIRALIVNSGQANAATGKQGLANNLTMAKTVEHYLNLESNCVLTASTGIIGEQLSLNKIVPATPLLISELKPYVNDFAEAIKTTDKKKKIVDKTIELTNGEAKITAIAKGSGMIHPNMGTMLAFILTDVKLTSGQTTKMLKGAVNQSFNMISIDGVTSTNDSVFMLANGASGISLSNRQDEQLFQDALDNLCVQLAKKIVSDGEGAHKLIEIEVNGADTEQVAIEIARGVGRDNLVKSAMNGCSPNWGRIICAIGNFLNDDLTDNAPLSIWIQDKPVYMNGQPTDFDTLSIVKELLHKDEIFIRIELATGKDKATAWTSDLSQEYVKINAEKLT